MWRTQEYTIPKIFILFPYMTCICKPSPIWFIIVFTSEQSHSTSVSGISEESTSRDLSKYLFGGSMTDYSQPKRVYILMEEIIGWIRMYSLFFTWTMQDPHESEWTLPWTYHQFIAKGNPDWCHGPFSGSASAGRAFRAAEALGGFRRALAGGCSNFDS